MLNVIDIYDIDIYSGRASAIGAIDRRTSFDITLNAGIWYYRCIRNVLACSHADIANISNK